LTGWHLDVTSETRYSQAMQTGYDSLVQIPGIGISLADALYEKGFYSAEELAHAAVEDLIQIRGIGEEKATKLIANAQLSITAAKKQAPAPQQTEAAASADQAPPDADVPAGSDETVHSVGEPDSKIESLKD
jgi:N utilization substance protein A